MRQLLTALLLILASDSTFGQTDCTTYQTRIDQVMAGGNYDKQSLALAESIKQQIVTVCQMGGTQMADMAMASFEKDVQSGTLFKEVAEDIEYLSTDELTDAYLRGAWCSGTPGEGEVLYLRFRNDGSYRLGVSGLQGPALREHMDEPGEVRGDTDGDWTGKNREAFLERFKITKLLSKNKGNFVAVAERNPGMEFKRGACWE
jgi:hypothetical protein